MPSDDAAKPPAANPACLHDGCGHPLRGGRGAGHFADGGPCKVPGCKCARFVAIGFGRRAAQLAALGLSDPRRP